MQAVASPDAGLQVSAPAAPAPAQATAPASPNQPAFPVPLSSQLSGQLTSLRQLPHGEHILTLTVNPETFGPVRVVAHITHDGVTLQLFGASDQARAALKAALPDLRRDLAGTGLQPNLELGSGSGSGSGGREAMGDPSSFTGNGNAPQRSPRPPFGGSAAAVTLAADHTAQATHRGALDLVI
jgi:flagellar hook-length control protein FliK